MAPRGPIRSSLGGSYLRVLRSFSLQGHLSSCVLHDISWGYMKQGHFDTEIDINITTNDDSQYPTFRGHVTSTRLLDRRKSAIVLHTRGSACWSADRNPPIRPR